jgi:hypothetical protein
MRLSWKQFRALDSSLVCGSNQVASLNTRTLRHLGRVTIVLMALALPFLAMGRLAVSQGIITGSISGTVVDPTGAIIPGADIRAVSESNGTAFEAKSNAEAFFQISDVPIGSYTVTVTASGFGQDKVTRVQVVAGNTTPLGKQTLTLGSAATTTIEVEGSASELINTESAQVETTIDAVQLVSAPVTGALDNMALMVPGVVNVHMDGNSNTNGINFSVNGQRGRSNNSEIDGQTNNDTSIGGPSFFFDNQDAIQEVQVLTTDMGAQYGRNMGGIVNYITKGGSNTFHGSAFEIYTGSWLSSLMQYQKDPNFGGCAGTPGCNINPPKFVQNNWGGTLGGPILKNKLFFFGSTLWSHTYEGGVVLTSQGGLFPDPTGLQTLQSSFASNPAVAAIAANGPYASKAFPATPTGATSTVTVTDGTTVANVEVAQFERSFPTAIFDQEHLGRIDYQMSDKDRFYLRYNYQNNPYNPGFYLVSNATAVAGGYPNVYGISHEVGGDWTHIFTPSMVNQLRYAFQQSSIGFYGGAIPTCTISDQSTCTSSVGMGGSFASYGYGASLPQGRFVKVNQIQDNATWTKGRHTILFGGEFDYQDSPWGFLPNDEGTFNFTPLAASNAANPNGIPFNYPASGCGSAGANCDNGLTGFLEGIGELNLSEGNPTIPFKEKDVDFYFQDNFKVSKSLTLNLGLRYEFFGQAINFLHNETVAQQTGSNPFWSSSLPLSATTIPSIPSFYRNIEPRIGFAYAPSNLPKLVVHGGYSINADPEFYLVFVDMATAAPAVNAGAVSCDDVTVTCVPSGGLTDATVQAADDKYIPTGGDPRVLPTQTVPSNFHNPQGETYSLGFQYQVAPTAVADVRYVGNHTYGQFQALNSNPDIASVQTSFPNYGSGQSVCTTAGAAGIGRPNCNYDQVEAYSNTAFSLYNALQTSLTVRNFHGFTGTASYTWSRDITNTSDFAVGGNGGQASPFAQNPLDSNLGERGVDGNSYPNIWGIQLTYTEPWFRDQHGILGRLLGGYMLNAFYQYNGGQAYNPIQNSYSVTSPNVLADISATAGNPGGITTGTAATISATQAETGFCDIGFTQAFGGNPCRPVLSNPSAPLGSIGINLGPGGYVDYVTGVPTAPSAEHWLWSNQYEAVAKGTPFPGVGRNILRGDSFNDVDISAAKTVHLTERFSMQMMVSAFNVLNRAYYGTPDINVEHSLSGGFESNQFAFGTAPGSGAGGGSYPQGLGNRNVQLTGKIIF